MEYISYSDKLFTVKRKIKEQHIKPDTDINPLKVWWHCDTILKKDGLFYFCNEIKEVSYEEPEN